MSFEENVANAVVMISVGDVIDGFKNRELETILAALECGLKRPETLAQFDAYVMLKEVCDERLRQLQRVSPNTAVQIYQDRGNRPGERPLRKVWRNRRQCASHSLLPVG